MWFLEDGACRAPAAQGSLSVDLSAKQLLKGFFVFVFFFAKVKIFGYLSVVRTVIGSRSFVKVK